MTSEAAVSARVGELVDSPIDRMATVGGGTFGRPYRATARDGREYFVKVANGGPDGIVRSEAAGLRWLAEATAQGGVQIAPVLAAQDDLLVLAWIAAGAPSRESAVDFGRRLAVLHRSGADEFGTPEDGFIASEPLPGGTDSDWASFYVNARLRPFLDRAVAAGSVEDHDRASVEEVIERIAELAGPEEPPARLHGDLWSGNVLWSDDGVVLIDPSAHGGHRESDLAMLSLFGLPHLDVVLDAYQQAWPLTDGWQDRRPLHQLYPLLVHATLFGGHYGRSAGAAARTALAAL